MLTTRLSGPIKIFSMLTKIWLNLEPKFAVLAMYGIYELSYQGYSLYENENSESVFFEKSFDCNMVKNWLEK